MRSTTFLLLGLAPCLAITACDSSSGIAAPTEAPSNLDYGTGTLSLDNCAELAPLVPTVDGTGITFSVAPPLPAGLTFNTLTGAIGGTPAAPEGSSFHTITAMNAMGSTTAPMTVNLADPVAPNGLSYGLDQLSLALGSPLPALVPSLDGGGATSYAYTITPALPAGLVLDPATGTLSGTASAPQPPQPFQVRALDCVGNGVATTVFLEVTGGSLGAATNPNLALVANADGTITSSKIDPDTGLLVPLGFTSVGGAIADLALSPDNQSVYVLLEDQNAIAGFAVDPAGRGLTALPQGLVSLPGAASVGQLLVTPDGDALYATDPAGDRVYGYSIGSFGALEPMGVSPVSVVGSGSGPQTPTQALISGDGSLLYTLNAGSNTVSALQLDGAGAVGGQVAAATGSGPSDLAAVRLANGTEIVYVANSDDATISVYAADPFAPSLTLLQTRDLPSGSFPAKIEVVNINGQLFVYALKTATQLVVPVPVNEATGLLDPAQAGIGAQGISDFGFAPNGSFGFLLSAAGNQLSSVVLNPDGSISPLQVGGVTVESPIQRAEPVGIAIVGSVQPLRLRTTSAYVTNADAGSLSVYDALAGGASLNPVDERPLGNRPIDSAVRPQGQRLFVVDGEGNASDDLFSLFLTDGMPGSPSGSEIGDPLFAGLGGARRLAVDPSGQFLFAIRGGAPGQLFGFQLDELGQIGQGFVDNAGNDPNGLVVDPSGRFVYVANRFGNNVSQHAIDPATGAISLVSAASVGAEPVDLALSNSGTRMYVLEAGGGGAIAAYAVNPVSGVLSQLGSSPDVSGDPAALAVEFTGRFLVVADRGTAELRLFQISAGDGGTLPGVPVLLDTIQPGGSPSDLAFDARGEYLYATLADTGRVLTYRLSAGQLSLVDDDPAAAGATGLGLRRIVD